MNQYLNDTVYTDSDGELENVDTIKYIFYSSKINPDHLIKLDCSQSGLTSLVPLFPKSLKILKCNINKLTLLPELPEKLEKLNCGNNKLTLLPELPKTLIILRCYDNRLTSLPTMPTYLKD